MSPSPFAEKERKKEKKERKLRLNSYLFYSFPKKKKKKKTAYYFPKHRAESKNNSTNPVEGHPSYTPESALPKIPENFLKYPSMVQQYHLIEIYFKYIHPYLPIVNKFDL